MVTIKLDGMGQLIEGLKKRTNIEPVKQIIKYHGARVQQEAKRLVPVDTGALKGSISLDIESSGLTAYIFATMHYSAYVEFGTRFMQAQPFLKPALESVKYQFLQDLEKLAK